jgi:hypothetical protein
VTVFSEEDLMIQAKQLIPAIAAILAAGVLALPAAAQAQTASPLTVTANSPTTVRINVHGKTRDEVLNVVRSAAHQVCRNAVVTIDLDLNDLGWCADRAQDKAMKQYAVIVQHRSLAQSDVIELAVR